MSWKDDIKKKEKTEKKVEKPEKEIKATVSDPLKGRVIKESETIKVDPKSDKIEDLDSEANREKFKKETNGRPILKGQLTKRYKQWLKFISEEDPKVKSKEPKEKIEESKEPKEKKEESKKPKEKLKKTKDKKKKVVSWKDEVTYNIEEDKFLGNLRKDLKDYIIRLKTEKIEIENSLLESEECGFIVILYGRPGIGKSIFGASGVLDNLKTVFLDMTNQGRRLKQFPDIYKDPLLEYERFAEKMENGAFDLSKNFEKMFAYINHVIYNYIPKDTILIIDGFNKCISYLNSYLRHDVLKIGDAKRGRQEDIAYGDWYWRTFRYTQLLQALEDGADKGFRIFLTAEVIDVVDVSNIEGKLKIKRTGDRAPNVRSEDLYACDIEAFFRDAYNPATDVVGPREIEIKVSKVPGVIEGTILSQPKMKNFLDLQKISKIKKLEFSG